MDVIILQAIEEVTIDGVPDDGITLDNECVIHPIKFNVLGAAYFLAPYIGVIQHETIKGAAAANHVFQVATEEPTPEGLTLTLLRAMAWTQTFLLALWLVKDNSGNAADGHILLGKQKEGPKGVITQRPNGLNFTADCHRQTTHFSKAELDEAVEHFKRLKAIIPQGSWSFDEQRPSGVVFDSRIVRTIYYTEAVRMSAEIAMKIAFQCLCFESLFASSADSISHRVSERAGLLIGTSGPDSRQIYADIRAVYGARSTVVHGNPIKQKSIPALRQVAVKGDIYLRRAIRTILETPALFELFSTNNATDIDEFFLKRIFPGEAPPAAAVAATPAD